VESPQKVIGHRGAAGHAPENTLASIRAAARLGVQFVEFDAKLSRDGHVILFHDERLERTTDGSGPVADMDFKDLKTLDAGAWFGEKFRGEPIPTLSDAIAALHELTMTANVEIKPDPGREAETGEAVARVLNTEWPSELPAPIVSSFKEDSLLAARAVLPDLPRALLVVDIPGHWQREMTRLGCTALHCAAGRLTAKLAGDIAGRGVVLRCYTVNDPLVARRLFSWGVEAVFSDYPDRITAT
jgi:glycerophosphoryl diester phosphodiesterase